MLGNELLQNTSGSSFVPWSIPSANFAYVNNKGQRIRASRREPEGLSDPQDKFMSEATARKKRGFGDAVDMRRNYRLVAVKYLIRKIARFAPFLLLLGTWLTMAPGAAGQTPVGCNTGWAAFQRITGSFQLTGSGSQTIDDGLGATTVNSVRENINGTVDMTAFGLPLPGGGTCYSGFWIGTSAILANLDEISTYTDPSAGTTQTTEIAVSGGQNLLAPPTSNPLSGPALQANPLNGTLRLNTGSLFGADTGFVNATQTATDAGVVSTQQVQTPWGPIMTTAVPAQGNFLTVPLPTTVGPITGSTTFQATPGGLGGLTANWTLTWNLTPIPPNLDLIVSIPAYAKWRPTAGRTEKDTGVDPSTGQPNTLEIDTQLVDKSTGQTAYPDKLVFSLVEDSTEPGVTLNWPPAGSATSDPDLTFDAAFNPLATVGPDGMTATLVPINGVPLTDTNAFVSPHDWGGWATLNVTATLGGQTITGHLQDDSNTTNILIPKRQPGSHVADIWKTLHNVALSTPDDDDSEPNPSGYPGCVGDGFTLYEEYRGFMENGKHIEGDPGKKDFFVENLIGADAEPGIFLFTELTGLAVHKDIKKIETKIDHANGTLGSILINFNFSQGAHVTDQHGVTIVTQYTTPGDPEESRMDGGLTILTVKGFHAKPGITDGIAMQPRDAPGTLRLGNNHGGVITASDAFFQYDVGIAHELLHSVGVDHHGDHDAGFKAFYFRRPDDPENPTGQPAYFVFDKTQQQYVPVQLLPEQGGPDAATTEWEKIEEDYNSCKAVEAAPALYPASVVLACDNYIQLINSITKSNFQVLYVGSPQAEHSGNDQCVMRYFFAQTYPSVANSSTYYLVPAGTEPLGTMLCDAAVGTGVNDPNRKPQPRYFDAAPGRGGCQFWVCVSDNKNYPFVPD